MRAVIQRVKKGSVTVDQKIVGKIAEGLVVLLGVTHEDTLEDAKYLAEKIVNLRIFEDDSGKLNLSVKDFGGEILCISQFTLFGDIRKGRRPSFTDAAKPDKALELYNMFNQLIEDQGLKIEKGIFQAYMQVEIINDGPVTMLLDSKKVF